MRLLCQRIRSPEVSSRARSVIITKVFQYLLNYGLPREKFTIFWTSTDNQCLPQSDVPFSVGETSERCEEIRIAVITEATGATSMSAAILETLNVDRVLENTCWYLSMRHLEPLLGTLIQCHTYSAIHTSYSNTISYTPRVQLSSRLPMICHIGLVHHLKLKISLRNSSRRRLLRDPSLACVYEGISFWARMSGEPLYSHLCTWRVVCVNL